MNQTKPFPKQQIPQTRKKKRQNNQISKHPPKKIQQTLKNNQWSHSCEVCLSGAPFAAFERRFWRIREVALCSTDYRPPASWVCDCSVPKRNHNRQMTVGVVKGGVKACMSEHLYCF